MVIVLSPDQGLQVERMSSDLGVPADEVVMHLLSGPLALWAERENLSVETLVLAG